MTLVNIGTMIRKYRKQQHMKQDDLAIGICTTSYLSRIENNLVVADERVYRLLLERLGKDYDALHNEYEEDYEQLMAIYAKLLDDLSLSEIEISFLQQKLAMSLDTIQQLIYARYLTKEERLEEASTILRLYEDNLMLSRGRLTELWIGVSTYYNLSMGQYNAILERERLMGVSQYFSEAHQYEKAIYYYHLAFAAHRNYEFKKAKVFIKETIGLFTHTYKPLFQLKLYSMHGVILNALSEFQEAHKEFLAAIELLEAVPQITTNQQWASIYNNLAFHYESYHQFELAHEYYKKSLAHMEDLHSVINLMRVLCFSDNMQAVHTMQHQYPIDKFTIQNHKDQWQLIDCLMNVKTLGIEWFSKTEEQVMKSIVQDCHIELVLSYAPRLADVYAAHQQYKKMAGYYKLAFEMSEELRLRDK